MSSIEMVETSFSYLIPDFYTFNESAYSTAVKAQALDPKAQALDPNISRLTSYFPELYFSQAKWE